MEIFSSNITKIQEMETPKNIPYISGKWNFLVLILKKSYIFSKESFSYTSGNENLKQIFYIFSKENFSHILEKETPPKILYISGNRTSSPKLKKLPKHENQYFYTFPHKEEKKLN